MINRDTSILINRSLSEIGQDCRNSLLVPKPDNRSVENFSSPNFDANKARRERRLTTTATVTANDLEKVER